MTQERTTQPLSGPLGLAATIVLLVGGVALFVTSVVSGAPIPGIFLAMLSVTLGVLSAIGLFTVQPNQAVVLVLFGTYVGSVKRSGWWWTNPFMTKKRISLRARSLNGEQIKVNDNHGNPVEIAAVVVWKVRDTAQATFDVEDYERFVTVQSETAVRHLASAYPYDEYDSDGISLRGSTDKVSAFLRDELHERLKPAGV